MKKSLSRSFVFATLLLTAGAVSARDTTHMMSIADGMKTESAESKLDGSVKFYFADQSHPVVLEKFITDSSNRKTNSFGKSDETACNWAFLSALVAFENRAKSLGANAVINIVSDYKKNVMSSATQFECHAGAVVAGVALKGDFVKVKN